MTHIALRAIILTGVLSFVRVALGVQRSIGAKTPCKKKKKTRQIIKSGNDSNKTEAW